MEQLGAGTNRPGPDHLHDVLDLDVEVLETRLRPDQTACLIHGGLGDPPPVLIQVKVEDMRLEAPGLQPAQHGVLKFLAGDAAAVFAARPLTPALATQLPADRRERLTTAAAVDQAREHIG